MNAGSGEDNREHVGCYGGHKAELRSQTYKKDGLKGESDIQEVWFERGISHAEETEYV